MSTIQERLRGSIVPVVTPFDDENRVDAGALRRLIDWLISEGSHGISVGGTTGEPAALSLAERRLLMETAMDQVGGRVPVLLGTGSTNFEETMELTHHAAEIGADAALLIVPYYNKPSQEGLFQHFFTVARSVPNLPIVIYNIPGRTATNMEPATLLRLRKASPNIVGVKEANKDFEQVSNVLATLGRDFLVYSGIEALCYPMLAVGGAGHVSATGNILPRKVADLYNFVRDGRWEDARSLHYELLPINQALFVETNPAPLKAALGMMRKVKPHLRLPLVPITDEHRRALEQLLHRYGLLEEVGV